jgi:hypothetical protein
VSGVLPDTFRSSMNTAKVPYAGTNVWLSMIAVQE